MSETPYASSSSMQPPPSTPSRSNTRSMLGAPDFKLPKRKIKAGPKQIIDVDALPDRPALPRRESQRDSFTFSIPDSPSSSATPSSGDATVAPQPLASSIDVDTIQLPPLRKGDPLLPPDVAKHILKLGEEQGIPECWDRERRAVHLPPPAHFQDADGQPVPYFAAMSPESLRVSFPPPKIQNVPFRGQPASPVAGSAHQQRKVSGSAVPQTPKMSSGQRKASAGGGQSHSGRTKPGAPAVGPMAQTQPPAQAQRRAKPLQRERTVLISLSPSEDREQLPRSPRTPSPSPAGPAQRVQQPAQRVQPGQHATVSASSPRDGRATHHVLSSSARSPASGRGRPLTRQQPARNVSSLLRSTTPPTEERRPTRPQGGQNSARDPGTNSPASLMGQRPVQARAQTPPMHEKSSSPEIEMVPQVRPAQPTTPPSRLQARPAMQTMQPPAVPLGKRRRIMSPPMRQRSSSPPLEPQDRLHSVMGDEREDTPPLEERPKTPPIAPVLQQPAVTLGKRRRIESPPRQERSSTPPLEPRGRAQSPIEDNGEDAPPLDERPSTPPMAQRSQRLAAPQHISASKDEGGSSQNRSAVIGEGNSPPFKRPVLREGTPLMDERDDSRPRPRIGPHILEKKFRSVPFAEGLIYRGKRKKLSGELTEEDIERLQALDPSKPLLMPDVPPPPPPPPGTFRVKPCHHPREFYRDYFVNSEDAVSDVSVEELPDIHNTPYTWPPPAPYDLDDPYWLKDMLAELKTERDCLKWYLARLQRNVDAMLREVNLARSEVHVEERRMAHMGEMIKSYAGESFYRSIVRDFEAGRGKPSKEEDIEYDIIEDDDGDSSDGSESSLHEAAIPGPRSPPLSHHRSHKRFREDDGDIDGGGLGDNEHRIKRARQVSSSSSRFSADHHSERAVSSRNSEQIVLRELLDVHSCVGSARSSPAPMDVDNDGDDEPLTPTPTVDKGKRRADWEERMDEGPFVFRLKEGAVANPAPRTPPQTRKSQLQPPPPSKPRKSSPSPRVPSPSPPVPSDTSRWPRAYLDILEYGFCPPPGRKMPTPPPPQMSVEWMGGDDQFSPQGVKYRGRDGEEEKGTDADENDDGHKACQPMQRHFAALPGATVPPLPIPTSKWASVTPGCKTNNPANAPFSRAQPELTWMKEPSFSTPPLL